MEKKKLKAYTGYNVLDGPSEGAVLIFAHTSKEAKKISYWDITSLFGCEYVDVRVELLNEEHLFKEADQDKLKAGTPHVIDNPKVCGNCELWGGEPTDNGRCSLCEAEE